MFEQTNLQQISFFIILIISFGLLITERLRNDIVALLIVLALYSTRVLNSSDALSGFSSEPAIVVVSIFVLSAAFHHTGVSDKVGGWIGRLAGSSYSRILAVIMPSVALLSAFTHHVTTTAVMLPVTMNIAKEKSISASKLLMPLSFAASLGTTITIIGAPAFLIASSTLQQAGRPGLGIFSIAPIGLAISLAGTLFVLLVGRFLLPERQGAMDGTSRFRLDDYFTEFSILPESPFLNKTVEELEADGRYQFRITGWIRGRRRIPRPFTGERIKDGDVLLVRTSPEEMATIRNEAGIELHPITKYGDTNGNNSETDVADMLVQAVVAPGSDLIGNTIGNIDFRERFGAIVVGLWRRKGWMQKSIAKTRIRAGDVLVLQGDEDALARVNSDPAFLMLVPFQGETQMRRKAPLAAAIMFFTVLVAALNILPLEMATLAGAVAVVLTRCITTRQAYNAIDSRIYVFIAGAIPLGLAMQKTGASTLLATWLQGAIGGWGPVYILLTIFAVVGILTQFMSDAATTALFAPVAVALAQALGHAPEPYVVTVAMAAVASFLTPIGHHGNLLIYGPGGYQFADFVKVGAPLTIMVGIMVVFISLYLWGS
jgi:di/tricarboxylate transporter